MLIYDLLLNDINMILTLMSDLALTIVPDLTYNTLYTEC